MNYPELYAHISNKDTFRTSKENIKLSRSRFSCSDPLLFSHYITVYSHEVLFFPTCFLNTDADIHSRVCLLLSEKHSADSLASEHLSKDAAGAPDIHRCGIGGLQKNLRRPIPQCHHLRHTWSQSTAARPFHFIVSEEKTRRKSVAIGVRVSLHCC